MTNMQEASTSVASVRRCHWWTPRCQYACLCTCLYARTCFCTRLVSAHACIRADTQAAAEAADPFAQIGNSVLSMSPSQSLSDVTKQDEALQDPFAHLG